MEKTEISDLIKSQISKKCLEELNLLDRFVANVVSYSERNSKNLLEHINMLKDAESLCELLLCSFIWSRTPEGHKFWSNIAFQDKTP